MAGGTVRDCVRCSANTAAGSRCTRRTCKYPVMCWQHTIKHTGLKLMDSTIPGGGVGLFATKTFTAGETIATYGGNIMTTAAYNQTDSDYGIKINNGLVLDGKSTQSGIARYVNDCRRENRNAGHCTDTNAKLVIPNSAAGLARAGGVAKLKVKARNTIREGDEIYASYGGIGYWGRRNDNQGGGGGDRGGGGGGLDAGGDSSDEGGGGGPQPIKTVSRPVKRVSRPVRRVRRPVKRVSGPVRRSPRNRQPVKSVSRPVQSSGSSHPALSLRQRNERRRALEREDASRRRRIAEQKSNRAAARAEKERALDARIQEERAARQQRAAVKRIKKAQRAAAKAQKKREAAAAKARAADERRRKAEQNNKVAADRRKRTSINAVLARRRRAAAAKARAAADFADNVFS